MRGLSGWVAVAAATAVLVCSQPGSLFAATVLTEIPCGTDGGTLRVFLEHPTGAGGNSFVPAGTPLNDATGTRIIRTALIRVTDSTGTPLFTSSRPVGWTTTETTPTGAALTFNRWAALSTLGESSVAWDCAPGTSVYLSWRDETNPVVWMIEAYVRSLDLAAWTYTGLGIVCGGIFAFALLRAI